MEALPRQKPLEFPYQDMVFYVKPTATAADKMERALSGIREGGQIRYTASEYCRLLVRLMVVGWRGFERDGQPVPYSFPELEQNFPHVHADNIFVVLGAWISEHTDINKDQADAKNDSRRPSDGPLKSGPSTAAGKTVLKLRETVGAAESPR